MTSQIARVPTYRRSWMEPLFWLVIPALAAIGPWAARQWTTRRAVDESSQPATVRLTGDSRRDRLALLERAWIAARPQPAPAELPLRVLDRITRREATWLAEIAVQLLPLDPQKAEQAALEAIQRASDLWERMGPEEVVSPGDTPTGRLLALAQRCRALPAVAHRARRAALQRAQADDGPDSRVYALCLVAREAAASEPALAREALREARAPAARLSGPDRLGALAALAGSTARVDSPRAAQPLVAAVLHALSASARGPVTMAEVASLIAPAAPETARRLAEQAVERAAASTQPPEEDQAFRAPFDSGPPGARAGRFGTGAGLAPRATQGEAGPPGARNGLSPSGARLPPAATGREGVAPFRPAGLRFLAVPTPMDPVAASDAQLRRVAAALAPAHPAVAARAAARIRRPQDRSGSLTEVAALVEERDSSRALALYRLALRAADEIPRPQAAKRAARIRAATGLAAFDAPAALAVIEPFPPRLIALQLNEFASRLARQQPEAALRLIERGERSIRTTDNRFGAAYAGARAAVALQLARHDPPRAAALLDPPPGRWGADGYLALARGLAPARGS